MLKEWTTGTSVAMPGDDAITTWAALRGARATSNFPTMALTRATRGKGTIRENLNEIVKCPSPVIVKFYGGLLRPRKKKGKKRPCISLSLRVRSSRETLYL